MYKAYLLTNMRFFFRWQTAIYALASCLLFGTFTACEGEKAPAAFKTIEPTDYLTHSFDTRVQQFLAKQKIQVKKGECAIFFDVHGCAECIRDATKEKIILENPQTTIIVTNDSLSLDDFKQNYHFQRVYFYPSKTLERYKLRHTHPYKYVMQKDGKFKGERI
jgi:hypothetical protein